MKILLCGGGTAGHVNPALSIAEVIEKNIPNVDFLYVVTPKGIENRLVKYNKVALDVEGFNSKNLFLVAKKIYKTFRAVKSSEKIIREYSPDLIIGTGGYSCFPIVYAGKKLGVKIALHESNSVPGKTIRLCAKKADVLFLNFKECGKFFSPRCNVVFSGNPLRGKFGEYTKHELREKFKIQEKYVVLCYGGSLGAERINDEVLRFIKNVLITTKEIRLIWATGKKDYSRIENILRKESLLRLSNLDFREYIENMPEIMSMSDVVICRAGAMSISELVACKKSSILIPSPNVADDHQYKNARMLEEKKASYLLKEEDIHNLNKILMELLENENKRKEFENNLAQFFVKDSKKIILKHILNIL